MQKRYLEARSRWEEAAAKARAEGRPLPSAPRAPVPPEANPNRPSVLFNAMIAPLVLYAVQGVIWYQGEANAPEAWRYRHTFPALIRDWRRAFGREDLAFLFVQLAGYRAGNLHPEAWAELREAQTLALELPRTGMAVAIDIGDRNNIHPQNKQEVGRRLGLAALAAAYGRELVASGPIYEGMAVEGGKVRLRFRHAGGGLMAAGGEALKGFQVAGEDREFHPAEAAIQEDGTLLVSSPAVPTPQAVRYAWRDWPEANLYNREGLPASPFRTDRWPGVTGTPR